MGKWQNLPNPNNDPLIRQMNARGRRLQGGGNGGTVTQNITYSSGGGGGGYTPSAWYNLVYGATLTIDKANGDAQRVTLTGNAALADPVGFSNGDPLVLRIKADATGGWTVTPTTPALWELPSGFPLYVLANRVILLNYKFDGTGALLVGPPTII